MNPTTHTLVVLVPLAVRGASPGALEGERPEGLGGVRARVREVAKALAALCSGDDVTVPAESVSAAIVPGDLSALSAVLAEVCRG